MCPCIIQCPQDILSHYSPCIEMRCFYCLLVIQARQLATASSRLVTGLRDEAKALSADPQKQKQVLGSAKKLADSTAKMVECAKGAATHANDEVYQTGLKKATEDLRSVVDEAFGSVLRKKVSGHVYREWHWQVVDR